MKKIKSQRLIRVSKYTGVSNKGYASLLGIGETQRLNLRLMEIASFNNFDGPAVVKDLLDNRSLWQACLMDRESFHYADQKFSMNIDLIKLRDMGDENVKRLGQQSWNVDTLYILAYPEKKYQNKLMKLASKWNVDTIDWIEEDKSRTLLGGSAIGTRILRVWWD